MAEDAGITVYGTDLSDGMGWLYKKVLHPARGGRSATVPPPGAVPRADGERPRPQGRVCHPDAV